MFWVTAMKKLFILILSISTLLAQPGFAAEWRAALAELPLTARLNEDGSMTGVFVELIKAIDILAGEKTTISITPFKRSLRKLETKQADYHIPLIAQPGTNTDDLPYRFSTETLFQVAFVIYSHKDNPLDPSRLGDYEIATDRAHTGFFPFKTTGLSCISCGIRMVEFGRLDGFIFAQNEMDPFIKEFKLYNIHRQLYKNFDVKIVIPKGAEGDKINAYFSRYIPQLRASGDYEKIMAPAIAPYREWEPYILIN